MLTKPEIEQIIINITFFIYSKQSNTWFATCLSISEIGKLSADIFRYNRTESSSPSVEVSCFSREYKIRLTSNILRSFNPQHERKDNLKKITN